MRRTHIALVGAAAIGVTTLFVAPLANAEDNGAQNNPSPTDAPDGYYDDAEGKTGDELKGALNGIISGNEQFSYDEVWDGIAEADADPEKDGNVILIYTGRSEPAGGAYNREHVWAKSHGDFGTAIGPGTDMHHLRPSDETVNSTRSNLDFDNGGEEVEDAPGNFYDEDSFEPRDEVKGDVARMILYMAVRYEGSDGEPDLEPNDEVDNGKEPLHGRLSALKEWNKADPPDDFEKKRNDVIFENWQKNRNPFIDNPDWVDNVWS